MGYIIQCSSWNCHKEIDIPDKISFLGLKHSRRGASVHGGSLIPNTWFIFGEWMKVFCEECMEAGADVDPMTSNHDGSGVRVWSNCHWCGEYCWLSDKCARCKSSHCEYCPCQERNEFELECMICGEIGNYCKCDRYDKELERYDDDSLYRKTIKQYSVI